MTQQISQAGVDRLSYQLASLFFDSPELTDEIETSVIKAALPEFLRSIGVAVEAPTDVEFVQHNHDGGKAMPFGRKKPPGECPRCDQLRAGAAPREAHPALQAVAARRRNDEQTDAAMREHFAPNGPHARGECGPVCTKFDY